MAKFLTTTGLSYHLEMLTANAQQKLILISPYLKMNLKIRQIIEDKNRQKTVDIRIVYRENKLLPEEQHWLKRLDFIRTSFCENLHAKCYLNEKEAIIASLNLYDFSQINNIEMGVYITLKDDPELYRSIEEEARRVISIAKEYKISITPVDALPVEEGFCIRCSSHIKLDPEHPYCISDYQKWKKYADPKYEEKKGVCHICGKPHNASMERPACLDCYKKNKNLFKD